MSIHQFTGEWVTAEDRIRLRINTGDGHEYRFWLTRHFVAAFMGGARALAVQVLAQQHPPEIARAMDEFRQQSAGQQADFSRTFETQDHLPLGEAPVLLTGMTINLDGDQVTVVLGTAAGHEVRLQITETMLRGWVDLLDRLQQGAGWQISPDRDLPVDVTVQGPNGPRGPQGPAAGQHLH